MVASLAYTRTQKRLHWSIAVLVAAQYLVFDDISQVFGQGLDVGRLPYTTGVIGHIGAGTLISVLMVWRLVLRLRVGTPPPPASEPRLAKIAAAATHWAFYAFLIALPMSGLGAWFFRLEILGEWHDLGQTLLLWMLGLHTLAVLVHQFWWKSSLLSRMT